MRFSKLYCPTLRHSPSDAEVISHQLMLRAAMIKKVASGIYTLLPLGLKVVRKVEQIVREELNAIGAQELLMPMVIPSELWQQSGRWDKYGDELLRLSDRHEHAFCLGPTHEEVITDLIKHSVSSYKSLPLVLYQIQTKFRDERRPRFGLMRGREFIMKDAYSFHESDEDLDLYYHKICKAYQRIFKRCGLKFNVVDADNGAMGGSSSAEFMVTADTGEDRLLSCTCGYAANMELLEEGSKTSQRCPACQEQNLSMIKGIEVGHVFKLGKTYAKSMQASFLNKEGKQQQLTMGCYGIGIGRTVAATIEQCHDEKGIIWPKALAPFDVVIINTYNKDARLKTVAEQLYKQLQEHRLDVLLDDRAVSAGVKFADADLIGIPFQVIIGKTWVDHGCVELKSRHSSSLQKCSQEHIIEHIIAS